MLVESPAEADDQPRVRVTARREGPAGRRPDRRPHPAARLRIRRAGAQRGQRPAPRRAREEDLVRILDDLNAREERLREQIGDQRTALGQLHELRQPVRDGPGGGAQARRGDPAILNGTLAAQGPGLSMTVRDPNDTVRVADVLDAIQELRGAGVDHAHRCGPRRCLDGGHRQPRQPHRSTGRRSPSPTMILVIGSPQNMETALNIPGGVVPRFTSRGVSVDITQSDQVVVDALRPLDTLQNAAPGTGTESGPPCRHRRTDAADRPRRRSPHGHARRPPLHRPARVGPGPGHLRWRPPSSGSGSPTTPRTPSATSCSWRCRMWGTS